MCIRDRPYNDQVDRGNNILIKIYILCLHLVAYPKTYTFCLTSNDSGKYISCYIIEVMIFINWEEFNMIPNREQTCLDIRLCHEF